MYIAKFIAILARLIYFSEDTDLWGFSDWKALALDFMSLVLDST
jgi:hypothetical protein